MKHIGIVFAAVAALVIGATPLIVQAQGKAAAKDPPITAKQHEQGKADAPAALQAAKVACTVSDAYTISSGVDPKTKAKTGAYEVACAEGPGYVLQQAADKIDSFSCLALETSAKQSPAKGSYVCRLDANLDTKAGFGKLAAANGHPCTATGARYIGSGGGETYYEVACQANTGYVIDVPSVGKPVSVSDCIANFGSQVECQLTTKANILTGLQPLVAKSGKPCTLSDVRLVGFDAKSGSTYYEMACQGVPGFMLQANAQGGFEQAIDCGKAQSIGGGCSLTVIDETAEAGTYTKLAKGANYNCDVSKYRYLGKETKTNSEIVELACKDRPDGAIALFPISGGKAQVFDCLQGGSLGVTCQLTQATPLYIKYTDRLAAQGKTQCKVSGAKYLASTTAGGDLIETACSDGLPGFVISVDHSTGATKELLTCGQAKSAGAACTLPTNVAKN